MLSFEQESRQFLSKMPSPPLSRQENIFLMGFNGGLGIFDKN